MIVNNLAALSRLDERDAQPEGQRKPVASLVLKINIDKRVASFEETLMLVFLKAFKVDFQLETSQVPTFRGCKLS